VDGIGENNELGFQHFPFFFTLELWDSKTPDMQQAINAASKLFGTHALTAENMLCI
jgi:hypothetical protein